MKWLLNIEIYFGFAALFLFYAGVRTPALFNIGLSMLLWVAPTFVLQWVLG
jgi:hypothetical protein